MMNEKGLLIVVSGPSGCGKGTLLSRLVQENDNIFYSISATTREKRLGETDKVNYYFISKEEFENQIKQDNMLEYAVFCENYYGTPKQPVEQHLLNGNDVILEIEVQGALQVMKKAKEALYIFIMPPSIEELERRLIKRGTETPEIIKKRIERAKIEISFKNKYKYTVVNDNLERAYQEIIDIIKKEKLLKKEEKNNA